MVRNIRYGGVMCKRRQISAGEAGEAVKEKAKQRPVREKQVGRNNHPSMPFILHRPVCQHQYLKV